jgi:hypothetical protein
MRPIPSPASNEAFNLLKKAKSLLEKTEALEKGMKGMGLCPECGSKLEKGHCMMKAGCTMSKYGAVQKGDHHKTQSFGTKPDASTFHIETGGNTYHQQYSTNNTLLESEDVANKGASTSSVNIEALNRQQNPHDSPAPGHLTEG